MPLKVKDSSTWKTVDVPYVKDSGTWKKCHLIYVKDSGTWKESHRTAISGYSAGSALSYGTGTHSYTVPQGTRFLQVTVRGAGGGGSGGIGIWYYTTTCSTQNSNNRGISKQSGANGGKARRIVSTFEVVPGQVFTIHVGTGGGGGAGNQQSHVPPGYSGGDANGQSNAPYNSPYFYSTSGGPGGNTDVTSTTGNIVLRASGGSGGERKRARLSSHTVAYCTNPANFVWAGSPEISLGSVGADGVATISGTDASGASITASTNYAEDGTYGAGGSTGTYTFSGATNNSGPTGSTDGGQNGNNGFVNIIPYS